MKSPWAFTALLVSLSFSAAAQSAAGLHGVVTDPSGASVPGALVQLREAGVDAWACACCKLRRPMITTVSPSWISKSTPFNTAVPLKLFCNPTTLIMRAQGH